MAGIVNIGEANAGDAFYRYKMPKLIAKVEGRGNGIKVRKSAAYFFVGGIVGLPAQPHGARPCAARATQNTSRGLLGVSPPKGRAGAAEGARGGLPGRWPPHLGRPS